MYKNKKVYGPYTRNDGRQVVILKTPGGTKDHQTISYPKYIVECHIQRYLKDNETIDHIDGDFTNNELSNLRIVDRTEHCRSHTYKRKLLTKLCEICGKEFTTTSSKRVTCGSKQCIGKCAHINGYNKGNSFSYENNNQLESLRSSIEHIQPIDNSNT